MRPIQAAIREWLERRRRCTAEWAFHRERAAIELETLGLHRREAESLSARRLGRFSRYRRHAFHEAGAGLAGLRQALFPHHSLHTAWLPPLALAALLALLYAANPGRAPVWHTVTGTNFAAEVAPSRAPACTPRTPPAQLGLKWHTADPCVERAPWVQFHTIPAAFGKAASLIILLAGAGPLLHYYWRRRAAWLLLLYGLATLLLFTFIATTVFVTAMQYHLLASYSAWDLRIAVYVGYALAHTLAMARLFRLWRRDVYSRCPACLEPLRLPLERGHFDSVLLDPAELESLCIQGHGTLTETRWTAEFQESRPFWEDLAGTYQR